MTEFCIVTPHFLLLRGRQCVVNTEDAYKPVTVCHVKTLLPFMTLGAPALSRSVLASVSAWPSGTSLKMTEETVTHIRPLSLLSHFVHCAWTELSYFPGLSSVILVHLVMQTLCNSLKMT